MSASRHTIISFIGGIAISFLVGSIFMQVVLADTTSTQVTVNATVSSTGGGAVCGDGVIEGAEVCDDSGSNGACPATCSLSCTENICNNGSNNEAPTVTIQNIFSSLPESIITWIAEDNDGSISECTIEYGAVDPPTLLGTVIDLGSNTYSATVPTSLPLTEYYYDIRCTDNDEATRKEEGSFITPIEATVDIEGPEIIDVINFLDGSIGSVYWNATDNVAVDSCSFQYNKEGDTPYSLSVVVEEGSFLGTHAYRAVIESLIPATKYDYRIVCIDVAENVGSYLKTVDTIADLVPPPAVSNFSATPQGDDILLTWDYNDTLSDFFSYRIHFSFTNPPPFFSSPESIITVIQTISTTQYLHENVTKDIQHYYSIGVRDTSANWSELQFTDAQVSSIGSLVCGDGIVEGGEQCDDGNSNNNDNCTNTCTIAFCGDQIINELSEECDIKNLNGNSCSSIGYDIGDLSCTKECLYDVTQCISATSECGNGIIDTPEQCDDGNSNNNDACTNACTVAVCGDGVVEAGVEQCDQDELDGNSCILLGYDRGALTCTNGCTLDAGLCENSSNTGGSDPESICDDGVDNDLDGFIDCGDSDCSAFPACVSGPSGPDDMENICNDGVDNDLDGFIDCGDSDCSVQPACQSTAPACSDGFDNDADGYIDLADPGCEDALDDNEFNTDTPTVGASSQVPASRLRFLLAERTIETTLIDGVVTNLTGKQLTVIAADTLFTSPVVRVQLILEGNSYQMSLAEDGNYYADIITPDVGSHPAAVEVRYQSGLQDVIDFTISSQPYGFVSTDANTSIDGTQVTLYVIRDGEETVWGSSPYRQRNSQVVDEDGIYGYVVPNGTYRLVAEKQGFRERRTYSFTVQDNVVNSPIVLLEIPETVLETITFVADILQETVVDVITKVVDISDNPVVEEITEQAVVPIAAGASLVFVVPSLWSILLPLLRFLFLQPLLLIGQRKRESWGKVYHSLSKLPVDLAVVRLIDAKTKRIVQSRVTDKSGRYLFMVEPGTYIIEVSKQGFLFPSANLAGVQEDGKFLDVYHGEPIVTTEEATTLTPNIPLDSVKDGQRTVRRIVLERYLRVVQHGVSFLGVIVTAISLYIAPTLLVGGFLVLHLGLYGLFLRHIRPKHPKGWGIVYDRNTENPVGRVVARLFTKKYNKLVATQLTDSRGRYSFLVGPNEYYVSFEKQGYKEARTGDIDYSDRKEDIITENIDLEPRV